MQVLDVATFPEAHDERGSYERFSEAKRAAAALADEGISPDRITINGVDVHVEEQVVGRYHWGRVSMETGFAGALLGLVIGLIAGGWGVWASSLPISWALIPVAGSLGFGFGGLAGAILGPLTYLLFEKDRSFTVLSVLTAREYRLVVGQEASARNVATSRPLPAAPPSTAAVKRPAGVMIGAVPRVGRAAS